MQRPSVTSLNVKRVFDTLSAEEQRYAHHLACGAWQSTPIILRQVSPESPKIFALIKELYQCCNGNWNLFVDRGLLGSNTSEMGESLQQFLWYAATFLSNMGNYFGEGDKKFVPGISESTLEAICSVSSKAMSLFKDCSAAMLSKHPTHLGFPSSDAQSAYYLGPETVTRQDLAAIDAFMDKTGFRPRHTRLSKSINLADEQTVFNILIASSEKDPESEVLGTLDTGEKFIATRGDHAEELERIRYCLHEAREATQNTLRKEFLDFYREFFRSGDFSSFDNSQRLWMKDKNPTVETFLGFYYKYRDPIGVRAEFQGFVGLLDPAGSRELHELKHHAQAYIQTLPWFAKAQGGGKNGPFEMDVFQPPDFNGVHALAYCSTNLFLGVSLPAYCDNWKDYTWKNFMVKNVNQASEFGQPSQGEPAFAIPEFERTTYLQHIDYSVTFKVTLHELFGHGTGKLLNETNFDIKNPPCHPLTGEPIKTWYKADERTSTVFGELDMTLGECRADAVAAYLAHNVKILATMGYSDSSPITADDLIYNLYLSFGQLGVSGLGSYQPSDKKWTSAHDRARFGIMRALIAANDFMTVSQPDESSVLVKIDRNRIATDAKKAMSELATNLHVIIMSADRTGAEKIYQDLTDVDQKWLRIRDTVIQKAEKDPPPIFVQANTTLREDGSIRLVEYDPTVEGVIQSWMERHLEEDDNTIVDGKLKL